MGSLFIHCGLLATYMNSKVASYNEIAIYIYNYFTFVQCYEIIILAFEKVGVLYIAIHN